MSTAETKGGLNNSITKAVTLLNCFSYDQPRLRLKEISAMAKINQATAHRMLSTLKENNLIEHHDLMNILSNKLFTNHYIFFFPVIEKGLVLMLLELWIRRLHFLIFFLTTFSSLHILLKGRRGI